MAGFPSYTSFDYKPVTPVPVIASFDSQGHVAPLYVRMEGTPLKVDTYWVKSSFAHVTVFSCQVQRGKHLIPLLLSYYQQEGVWVIPEER
ncbi:MAG: hypothetical protein K5891_04100 [Lachnospiraceae bacterium]|nr:hypothetical protein [Lachnospiraceae bacterium]